MSGYRVKAEIDDQTEYLEETLFQLESQSVDPDPRVKSSIALKIKHILTGTFIGTKEGTMVKEKMHRKGTTIDTDRVDARSSSVFKKMARWPDSENIERLEIQMLVGSRDEDAYMMEIVPEEYGN